MSIRVIIGDVREQLKTLADESVHCVVTSPPYFGLRDYGTASWEGGDPACEHSSVRRGHGDEKQATSAGTSRDRIVAQDCKCGASRTDKQIGLEPTPAEFVAVMVDVFREVRRVLRKDGTLWLNLGDSYAGGGGFSPDSPSNQAGSKQTTHKGSIKGAIRVPQGIKAKDLLGIPWRVAFALQADGWYLRQDIIWSKPNPMPESIRDRCTKAHEYLFLLSKSARYHYDAEAIAENALSTGAEIKMADGWDTGAGGHGTVHREGREKGAKNGAVQANTRNRRSVWTVAAQPFREAHFATFPPDLIEPAIKAGCPKDCCAKCGAPVVREVQSSGGIDRTRDLTPKHALKRELGIVHKGQEKSGLSRPGWRDDPPATKETIGWSPSCSCDAGVVRGTVLDPFGGAGTTGLVADRLQRDAILIELNPEYAAMMTERITDDAPLFAVLL